MAKRKKEVRDYSPKQVMDSDSIKAKRPPLEPFESFQVPFSPPIVWRGVEYPNNFRIDSRWNHGEIPPGTIIGYAASFNERPPSNLVWDGKGIVVLSKKRWRNGHEVR